ncbi:MAG: DUF1566 domain-containing protein [Elusimicrobia bacterium]|nr:DUF1566 domain-containing protein [Elusimicrobiota bacterium]
MGTSAFKILRRLSFPLLASGLALTGAVSPAPAADISTHSFAGCNFPGTGQTVCYNASAQSACPVSGFPGQDAETATTASRRRFTVYNPVGISSVTVDNLTGLMWVSNLRTDSGLNYTATWRGAIAACENLDYAGYTDWRLPNVREALSMLDLGTTTYLDPEAFPGSSPSGYHWTSTTHPTVTSRARYIATSPGVPVVGGASKGSYYYAFRCVRGGP